MRRPIALFFMLAIMSLSLKADTFSLAFFQNRTDNIFQNAYPENDQLSSINFYLDKDFSKISLFTEGNYVYAHQHPSISYSYLDAGLDYLYPTSEKSAFYFALIGQGTYYRLDYEDFNYLSLNFLGVFKNYLSPTSIFKMNYILEYKHYGNSLFDFISHSLDASFDAYFQTRTTIKAELGWGYKYYLNPDSSEGELIEESHGFRGGRGDIIFNPSTADDGQAIQIAAVKGLIAQGIGSRVGLNISGMWQWTLSGENPFSSAVEFYMVENPSYDRFSWQGYQIGSELTMLIPWNIELKIGYTRYEKEFPGIESLDLEGNPLGVTRQDTRGQFEARLEKNFSNISLFLSYLRIDNQSNDPLFDWQGNFLSAGLEWNVFFGVKK
jgi:hypothetical protein